MLQTVLQTGAPETIMDLLRPENFLTNIAVVVLWAVAFMYGWWALSGKEVVPRRLMAITFIIITLTALMITFYLSPEFYELARTNIVQFAIVFIGSGVFGIILLPTVLLMAIGAVLGWRGRK